MQLAILTFAATCAYVGAGLYMNIVEQPARLQLNAQAMVHEWEPSNRRGFVLQSALAIVSAIVAYAYYARTGDARWIIGGTIMLASLPYAYFVIVPVNIWLYALEEGAPPSTLQELMRSWGLLEWGHTLIGVVGAVVLAWALIKPA
jgi:Anthrone oxygenase